MAAMGTSTFQSLISAGLLTTKPGYRVVVTYQSETNKTYLTTEVIPQSQRFMERLDRGLVAVYQGSSKVFLSWRLFGTDPDSIAFNLYRNGVLINASPITGATNYVDYGGTTASTYSIRVLIDGIEQSPTESVKPWSKAWLTIPLRTPDGYTPNDASIGDLDGDGQYEIILHQAGVGKDNSQSGYTDPPILQAYKLDGAFLWEINLGINIREGAHYTQFMVYDLDCDGRAELVCKTADGTVDGRGVSIGDPAADWRNSSGYILSGPEYLTVFDGLTGAALDTVDYVVPRGSVSAWGDSYGNRVDRFLACVAYLDGEMPSVVMCRGYYTRAVLAAWDYRYGHLSQRWIFDSDNGYSAYRGQGNHNLSVADVDNDGRDEIIYGACAIDDDGAGLYATGFGHGDALHASDLDPDRPGLEVFDIHEGTSTPGSSFRDARTGEIIWQTAKTDIGRGVSADIDPRYPGFECWFSGSKVLNCHGEQISTNAPSSCNMVLWWDGDLSRELLNGTTIDKWNPTGSSGAGSSSRLLTAYLNGAASNNGTKSNPCLHADILGDWREEVIWRNTDNQSLMIYTTTIPTDYRIYTLMHDPTYRLSVAWQNVAYNQPTQAGFYLANGMIAPPKPNIRYVGDWSHTALCERWINIDGTAIENLTTSPAYPNAPAATGYITQLETTRNWAENYGTRIRGYLIPPQTGSYTFWIAGDDNCQLWLSPDARPQGVYLIAQVPGWTGYRQWDKFSQQQSQMITLDARHKYYFEILHKEGTVGDHLSVAWQGPSLDFQIVSGDYLAPWTQSFSGDLNADGAVNMLDLAALSSLWFQSDCALPLQTDLNGDCFIDLNDWSVALEQWLKP